MLIDFNSTQYLECKLNSESFWILALEFAQSQYILLSLGEDI